MPRSSQDGAPFPTPAALHWWLCKAWLLLGVSCQSPVPSIALDAKQNLPDCQTALLRAQWDP